MIISSFWKYGSQWLWKNELKNVYEIDTFLAKINKYSDKKYIMNMKKRTHSNPEPAFCHNASIYQRLSHTWYTSTWRHPHVPSTLMVCYFHQTSKLPFQLWPKKIYRQILEINLLEEKKKKNNGKSEEKLKSTVAGIDDMLEWYIIFTEWFRVVIEKSQ